MALRNANLTKIGSTIFGSSGHSQMCLVRPSVALADPGPRNLSDPTWPARNAAYLQSIQIEPKYSTDAE
jgi:hypothetical protein